MSLYIDQYNEDTTLFFSLNKGKEKYQGFIDTISGRAVFNFDHAFVFDVNSFTEPGIVEGDMEKLEKIILKNYKKWLVKRTH